jgi:hypothetical protein
MILTVDESFGSLGRSAAFVLAVHTRTTLCFVSIYYCDPAKDIIPTNGTDKESLHKQDIRQ